MPTYEYVCSKCGHTFEKYQSIVEDALTVCPKELCKSKKWGKGKVKRAISAGGGIIFKGSGFYETDYRSDAYKAAAKKDVPPVKSETPSPASTPSSSAAPSTPGKPSPKKA